MRIKQQLVECPFNTFTMNYYKYSLPLDGGGAGGGEESLCCPLPLIPSHQGRGDIFGKVIYESKH